MVSIEILFKGQVQGVGFRNSTLRLSKNHNISGEVKNLASGDVLLNVEGTNMAISDFVSNIKSKWIDNIEESHQKPVPFLGFKEFIIKY